MERCYTVANDLALGSKKCTWFAHLRTAVETPSSMTQMSVQQHMRGRRKLAYALTGYMLLDACSSVIDQTHYRHRQHQRRHCRLKESS